MSANNHQSKKNASLYLYCFLGLFSTDIQAIKCDRHKVCGKQISDRSTNIFRNYAFACAGICLLQIGHRKNTLQSTWSITVNKKSLNTEKQVTTESKK